MLRSSLVMEDDMEWKCIEESHPSTIIHIDIDCFYAQVEMVRKPDLQSQPVGVQQKNIVVTCNYKARMQGVEKCMLVTTAMKLCPSLVLVNGEDLYHYRQASNQIHALLLRYTSAVEKLGLDENFLDVSDLVATREPSSLVGHLVGDPTQHCHCGCHQRLSIASCIALELRECIRQELGLTSCCGVSYNKLLAKLVGSRHKPDQQTTLFPNAVSQFMLDLNEVQKIPGIGTRTKCSLGNICVRTVKDLQAVDLVTLQGVVGAENAKHLKNLSWGVDNSIVKPSGKPQTIGLEDGFRKISLEREVKEKLRMLLVRLMTLVAEDGRVPLTVRVTVRKYDAQMRTSHKETKQAPIPGSIVMCTRGTDLSVDHQVITKLLAIIMSLFNRLVNISQPFHLTLLGLAFTKFQDKPGSQSIASFLLKKRDLSVQSLTTFVSDTSLSESTECIAQPSCSTADSDAQDTEPCPKKTKLDVLIKKRKLEEEEEDADLCSPSKLKVADLSITGDSDIQECPREVDPQVFRELPYNVQQELLREWRLARLAVSGAGRNSNKNGANSKQSLIHKYCIPNK